MQQVRARGWKGGRCAAGRKSPYTRTVKLPGRGQGQCKNAAAYRRREMETTPLNEAQSRMQHTGYQQGSTGRGFTQKSAHTYVIF